MCMINRYKNKGFCGANSKLKVAYYSIHKWEEPIISYKNGSGTVFFSNCNLKCIYCQNKKISALSYGKYISIKRLSEIFIQLQHDKVHNINLVTPTHYVPSIIKAIKKAKLMGLNIPIVYNTSSYENVETIDMVAPFIDVYLADLRYYSNIYASMYSKVSNYFEVATNAIDRMVKYAGGPLVEDGVMKKGVIVRVLAIPGLNSQTLKLISYLYGKYKDNIYISIMNQYTPISECEYSNLNRSLSIDEYNEIVNYAYDLGVRLAFIQGDNTNCDSFIPIFDKKKV